MSNFEIKTHNVGRTYTKPHFFILNKGLNSGKPLENPCPNCFVIAVSTEDERNTLFYLCYSLFLGRYFEPYLKGSVILFITINDCLKLLKTACIKHINNKSESNNNLKKVLVIEEKENNLKEQLKLINQLKVAFIRANF
ncbi:hypothetical protein R3X25_10035 [Lutibacter sp. TH_r2]|uniref:DUF6943 family protein n=1 Tax=Lutibacter sp. TH_r2 TaxID=3082083 RepID=UPI002954486B|nr:hypothetical protein [Lutibacter sp. TH_r2]MDV7187619.1 hypothetical protein [Lutibacter sp. TH_r2]